jgi:predicted  nucleic acid-binding Zn-ribbon protein
MWKDILQFGKDLVLLSRETQENKADIKKCEDRTEVLEREVDALREDFNKLVHLVHQLSYDIEKVSSREEAAREKMALQLENEMLKFERRLPQGKDLEK